MKKFIVNFDYKGFLFSAKVLVKRDNGNMLISTAVISNQLAFLLNDGKLMFIQKGNGFQLLLFKQDRSFEILNWNIKLECQDKRQIVDSKVFSLS
ncbi:MAG: hypothetical protein JWQ09_86 [Segetibacter sp.]|nr:hypothetical protein [Segetibacter sp.]